MSEDARKAAALVTQRAQGRSPKIGLVLGSGLGGLGDKVEDPISFSFEELPGFPEPTVEGHAGRLIIGKLGGVEVACLQGRVHLYEGHPASSVQPLVRTLKLLGCETLVLTNAAGALDLDATPGDLMLITDHINGQGTNPLVGPNDDSFGPRFPPMTGAYNAALRDRLREVAKTQGTALREGVYMALMGPCFETPAEIRAATAVGANAVGMSTVPEVIVARHCGMECAAVSVLTNMGAGLADEELSHDQTLEFASKASERLQQLIIGFVATFASPDADKQ